MQAAGPLILAGLLLGAVAALFGLSWPARPRLHGHRAERVRIAAMLVLGMAVLGPVAGWTVLPAGAALVFLALTDLRRFALPWSGLILLGCGVCLVVASHSGTALEQMAAGAGAFVVFLVLRRVSGRPPRMGFGDVVLAGLSAALLGWRIAPLVFALAALAPLALQRLGRRSGPVPFGFWLSLATLAGAGVTAA